MPVWASLFCCKNAVSVVQLKKNKRRVYELQKNRIKRP